MSDTNDRLVQLEIDVLAENDKQAAKNRQYFEENSILALNLVSSPGSGKTTLLCETINKLKSSLNLAVIEGDQQTLNDAERIRSTGCRAIQVNTGEGCHLDASMIDGACRQLKPQPHSVLFIENVGNLVCPAAFDLGEDCKVAVLSITEGEDKPIKYPYMFQASRLMILNKIDLLPYLNFDINKCVEYAKRVNPDIEVIQLSATSSVGMQQWCDWISNRFKQINKK